MPSPPNETAVSAYFARLASPLAPLPADVRDTQMRELQQHLDALVAAREAQGLSPEDATVSALVQMGDPAQIGRKLCREWRRAQRDPFWPTVIAIGLTQLFLYSLINGMFPLPFFAGMGTPAFNGQVFSSFYVPVQLVCASLLPILVGILVGRLLPERAIAGAFFVGLIASVSGSFSTAYLDIHSNIWAVPGLSVSGNEILAAYIASSLKRRDWKFHLE